MLTPLIKRIVASTAAAVLPPLDLAVQSHERPEQPEALDDAEAKIQAPLVGRTGSIVPQFCGRV
jgi:hypothetical protein